MIPTPWVALVLALGVFRLYRLLGVDEAPPLGRWRSALTGERVRWDLTRSQEPIYSYDRATLAYFLGCGYCLGAWCSIGGYVCWLFEPRWTLYGLAPFALSAAVGLIARNGDK